MAKFDDSQFSDASAMAQAVRAGEISPIELVEAAIAQADALNPALNAIVSERYALARQEARERDFSDLPFAGVPIFIKDLGQDMAGLKSTSGSRLFKDYVAQKSITFVERLEALGFIILGNTNTPEFGFKNISDSSSNGIVNLPIDHARNAGGSSGGSAALVAAGVVPLAAASDGGGSIRIPASFNGLIGLKPSRGRIPAGPDTYRGWQGASVHFALTKSVADTKALLYHLQDCQMESPFPLPLLSKEEVFETKVNGLKIALLSSDYKGQPLSDDLLEALAKTKESLVKLGHQVIEINSLPLDMSAVMQDYYFMNAAETAAMFDGIASALGRSVTKDDMEVMTWAIYQAGQDLKAKDYSKVLTAWDRYSAQMHAFHEDFDLLLTPTTFAKAPLHGQLTPDPELMAQLANAEIYSNKEQLQLVWDMFDKGLALNPYTPLANLTGQPAISLPLYSLEENYPLGIQFMATKGREDLLLALAQQLEDAGLLKKLN